MEIYERSKIQRLFSPYRNGNIYTRNRFVRAATWMSACDDETGRVSSLSVSYHIQAASGGAGTVISEFAYISPEGKTNAKQWGIENDGAVSDVEEIAAGVHASGSKFVVQICHSGGATRTTSETAQALGPSAGRYPGLGTDTREMNAEDISKVRRDFAAAAKRAKDGGADGVEIHAAHGFLLTQFLSPLLNKRTDEYGGSLNNRLRLTREVCADVRAAVGNNFPIWVKLSITEGTEGGYTSDEGIESALVLLSDGCDLIEISSGTGYSAPHHSPSVVGVSAGESEAPFAPYARKIRARAAENKTVLLTGGLRSLPVMACLLDEGACDLFGISRPFIAEPDLINRWAEDDARPSACVSCNACFRTALYGPIDCPIMRDKQEGEWDPL